MNPSSKTSSVLVLCVFVLLPFTLQTVGLFTPYWVSTEECDSVGLVYSCCSEPENRTCENTKGANELNEAVLGLEVASFALMLLAVTTIVFDISYQLCYNRQDQMKARFETICCCLVMLTIGGILTFTGCLLIEANFKTPQLGWSYYLCQVTGSYYVFLTLTVCASAFCSLCLRR